MKKRKKEDDDLPKWLRIAVIIAAIIGLIIIMFSSSGPFRTDFPVR